MADPVVSCTSCRTKNRVPVATSGHPRCSKCHTDLPWVVDVGDAGFAPAVDTDQLVIVDLWAPWCGPCRMVAPILTKLAGEFAGRLKVVKVNVDESPKVARRFEARSIPMMLFMRRGEVINTVVGAQPEHVMRTLVTSYLRS